MQGDQRRPAEVLPGDARGVELARNRSTRRDIIQKNSRVFCALHGYALLGWCVFPTLHWFDGAGIWLWLKATLGIMLIVSIASAWIWSLVVGCGQTLFTLRNAATLRWWMVVVGALPWMVIATEAALVLLVLWML